jgi:hypothetical protein
MRPFLARSQNRKSSEVDKLDVELVDMRVFQVDMKPGAVCCCYVMELSKWTANGIRVWVKVSLKRRLDLLYVA